jgi:hypothetical protein
VARFFEGRQSAMVNWVLLILRVVQNSQTTASCQNSRVGDARPKPFGGRFSGNGFSPERSRFGRFVGRGARIRRRKS